MNSKINKFLLIKFKSVVFVNCDFIGVCSSGTTGGKQKIFPANYKHFEKIIFYEALRSSIFNR